MCLLQKGKVGGFVCRLYFYFGFANVVVKRQNCPGTPSEAVLNAGPPAREVLKIKLRLSQGNSLGALEKHTMMISRLAESLERTRIALARAVAGKFAKVYIITCYDDAAYAVPRAGRFAKIGTKGLSFPSLKPKEKANDIIGNTKGIASNSEDFQATAVFVGEVLLG